MKPCPREVYHYQLLEYIRRSLWLLSVGWLILLLCQLYSSTYLPIIGCLVLMATCGLYSIAAYLFLLIHNVEVLRTFKVFSKNLHPALENIDNEVRRIV